MLTWPHRHGDWAPWLDEVEPVFADIAFHIAQRQTVLINAYDEAHGHHIDTLLEARGTSMDKIRLHIVPSNDTWARDHGPITVMENGQPRLLDFTFNGWGNKYDARLDNAITSELARQGAFGDTAVETIDLVLEGGSIDTDGQGTLLTTRACLLNRQRNPQLSQAMLEQRLGELLGVYRFLWLHHGYLAGDDTDSHIDTLARFCDAETLCYVSCTDENDEHYPALQGMAAELRSLCTVEGTPYRLIPLPMPAPIFDENGQRLPATYANFLIINGAVLVPTYRDETDAVALERLAGAFPRHEIIAIDALPLVKQYGSLHCVTMQLPQGVLKP